MTGELRRRLLVAAVGVPLAILLVWGGGWFLGGALALVAGASAREFFALAEGWGAGRPVVYLGVPAAMAFPLMAAIWPTFGGVTPWAFSLVLVLALGSLATAVWCRSVDGGASSAVAATVLGAVYCGGTLAFGLLLRHLPDSVQGGGAVPLHGTLLVALPFTATWIGDSSAYFAGRRWGVRKLMPRVSPGKTVVGGIAGLVGSAAGAVVIALLGAREAPIYGLSPLDAVVMGVLLGVAAQVGDLGESLMKREAGVKDSSHLIPGHGGVLDRFDALFFTIPLTFLLVILNAHV